MLILRVLSGAEQADQFLTPTNGGTAVRTAPKCRLCWALRAHTECRESAESPGRGTTTGPLGPEKCRGARFRLPQVPRQTCGARQGDRGGLPTPGLRYLGRCTLGTSPAPKKGRPTGLAWCRSPHSLRWILFPSPAQSSHALVRFFSHLPACLALPLPCLSPTPHNRQRANTLSLLRIPSLPPPPTLRAAGHPPVPFAVRRTDPFLFLSYFFSLYFSSASQPVRRSNSKRQSPPSPPVFCCASSQARRKKAQAFPRRPSSASTSVLSLVGSTTKPSLVSRSAPVPRSFTSRPAIRALGSLHALHRLTSALALALCRAVLPTKGRKRFARGEEGDEKEEPEPARRRDKLPFRERPWPRLGSARAQVEPTIPFVARETRSIWTPVVCTRQPAARCRLPASLRKRSQAL